MLFKEPKCSILLTWVSSSSSLNGSWIVQLEEPFLFSFPVKCLTHPSRHVSACSVVQYCLTCDVNCSHQTPLSMKFSKPEYWAGCISLLWGHSWPQACQSGPQYQRRKTLVPDYYEILISLSRNIWPPLMFQKGCLGVEDIDIRQVFLLSGS